MSKSYFFSLLFSSDTRSQMTLIFCVKISTPLQGTKTTKSHYSKLLDWACILQWTPRINVPVNYGISWPRIDWFWLQFLSHSCYATWRKMYLTAHARATVFGVLVGFDWLMSIGTDCSSASPNTCRKRRWFPTVCAGLKSVRKQSCV